MSDFSRDAKRGRGLLPNHDWCIVTVRRTTKNIRRLTVQIIADWKFIFN